MRRSLALTLALPDPYCCAAEMPDFSLVKQGLRRSAAASQYPGSTARPGTNGAFRLPEHGRSCVMRTAIEERACCRAPAIETVINELAELTLEEVSLAPGVECDLTSNEVGERHDG